MSPSAGVIPCPSNRTAIGCSDIANAELDGYLIRLVGSGFGPLRADSSFEVLVGNETCVNARVESDLEIACVLPPLLGGDWPVSVLVGGQSSDGPTVSFATPVVQSIQPSALLPSGIGGQVNVALQTRGLAPSLLLSIEIGGAPCDLKDLSSGGLLECSLRLPESFSGTDG